MADIKKLREELEQLKSNPKTDLDLKPIDKWMTEALNVVRIDIGKGLRKKKGKGSKVTYFHAALKVFGRDGFFTVHLQHGRHKNRQMISKFDFKKYIYPRLFEIILVMESEEQRG